MLFEDTYKSVESVTEGIFRDKGSRFIAYLYPITSENEIKILHAELKAMHPKARHHCWAMRIGPDRTVFRINDDGEPSGTAGKPILNTLLSSDLTNVLAVVVRYFGGTLLGVPGLINAYRSATQDAIYQATIVEKTINVIFKLEFQYSVMNEVMRIIKDENLVIYNQEFDLNCSLAIEIRQSQVPKVLAKLDKVEGLQWKG
jgi:uncharacterized YigZ family protein